MSTTLRIGLLTVACAGMIVGQVESAVDDVPFIQEYHVPYPIDPGGAGDDVRAIAVDKSGAVWTATKAGLRVFRNRRWTLHPDVTAGPTYDVLADDSGSIWVGAWDGLYCVRADGVEKIPAVDGPVAAIGLVPGGMMALGPDGGWRSENGKWQEVKDPLSRNVRGIALDPNGDVWVATGMGLYRLSEAASRHYYRENELISGDLNALAFGPDGRLWIGGLGGIDVYKSGIRAAHFTGKEGLPNYDVRSLTFAPDGTLWIGTALGVARFDGETWSLRHSRRWLLSDDVRDVTIDSEGTAWVATRAGVSAIKKRTMTLADKADYYLDICLKRHVRPPGFVEKCYFPNPNDTNRFLPLDDDNDGQYTSMYLAMECFRYAVTKDPKAKANADKAYEALEFLQTVTGTDGFFARTVIPSSWTRMADSNEDISPEQAVERRVRDPRNKIVRERWRLSSDRKWLWKGDTSSDEITGHMFGYLYYYDLAADKPHKERVRRLVRKIMDHVIDEGYVLRDIDGQATLWGVWSPEKLNGDPDWRVEKPINSFEILSFLKTACHITGDPKYQGEYRRLINKHGYAENARRPKAYGLSERTHIDDDLLALSAPGLMLNEDDPELHAIYMEGLTWAYRTVANDQNPYFNFIFGLIGGEGFHLEESVAFLRDTPLDLRQWTVDNSQREDIQLLRRPMLEPLQTSRMLPPSERGVMRWDKNPWAVISGDFNDSQGSMESCGVFWLLPYWMGRYYGFIQAPQ
ncbi:MAG: two-component regulator propeller domain-containing protein [bacterium]